jgi:hypothetical protein
VINSIPSDDPARAELLSHLSLVLVFTIPEMKSTSIIVLIRRPEVSSPIASISALRLRSSFFPQKRTVGRGLVAASQRSRHPFMLMLDGQYQ